jgi:hypothetical protein
MFLLQMPPSNCTYRLFLQHGLALPASNQIRDWRATTPVGVFTCMRQQLCNFVPMPLGLGSLQVKGLGDGMTGHRQLYGQESRVERCLWAWRVGLLWACLHMVCMCEEEGKGAGDERGRQNRLHSRQVEMQARDRPLVDCQVMLQSENLRVEHSSGLA